MYSSPLRSPAPSLVSLAPSSTGSEQDLSQPPDTLYRQPSPHFVSSFASLRLTNDSGLSDNGVIAYNGSSNDSSTSSYDMPSPDPPSPHFSNSSRGDGRHLSINNSPDLQHLGSLHSPTSPFQHSSGSDEFLSNFGPNYSPGSPSSYHSTASSFDLPYSEGGLPQSLPGMNRLLGFHSSSKNFFLTRALPSTPPEQFPPQSPEPDYYPRFPLELETIPYSGLQSPAREHSSPFGSLSPPEFVQGSSQVQHIDLFCGLGDPFKGRYQADGTCSFLEPEQDGAQSKEDRDITEKARIFKPQVSTPAGFVASEKKRKNPHKWICTICKRGFTRKYSHSGKFNYLFSVSCHL